MWDVDAYERAARAGVAAVARYVAASQAGEGPAVSAPPLEDVLEELDLRRLVREGGLDADRLGPWLETFLERSTRLHHPGELAHQVASPDIGAALADLVHGAINQPMSIYEMGAAANAAEVAVVEWMAERIGWGPGAGGVLTHGGSLANLTGLLAARAAAAPSAWTDGVGGDLAVLAPPSAHYSVKRSVAMLGLGELAVVPLDVDEYERIVPAGLEAAVERSAAGGRRPMALVAAACATSTGLHDDLDAIGRFCRERGIWFHVDAAHGASALLSEEHRHLLRGIEQSDSVVWDAHKMLRTSSLCAAVLVREAPRLEAAFRQQASYLIYDDPQAAGPDLLGRQVECTKAPLGLKVLLNLALRGERGLGEYVAEQYDKTLRFWELISACEGFECLCRPESNILCFRYGDDDALQIELRERLLSEGRFHLSSTVVSGVRWLRMSVMAPATSEETIEELLEAIERLAGAQRSFRQAAGEA
ncbi:MAG TPA: pyridoxal-dependent decarboxylase [Thermoleophilaceae bacterium]|nr:pyridoxal-dependent decarboxylase [Thermoleophilaceae bacterium]